MIINNCKSLLSFAPGWFFQSFFLTTWHRGDEQLREIGDMKSYQLLTLIGRAGHITIWNRSIALERTLILGAMALNKKKSEERRASWQNQILSGSLMSDIRKKERSKNGWKTHKNSWFVHILIKNDAKQQLIVVFSIYHLCFISCVSLNCVKDMPPEVVFTIEFMN